MYIHVVCSQIQDSWESANDRGSASKVWLAARCTLLREYIPVLYSCSAAGIKLIVLLLKLYSHAYLLQRSCYTLGSGGLCA